MKKEKFSASIDHLHEILLWIRKETTPFGQKFLKKIELASEEALLNIIQHSYANRGGEIEIQILIFSQPTVNRNQSPTPKKKHSPSQKYFQISFIDKGISFDPLLMKEVTPPISLEAQPLGGLGVSLMRKSVDEMAYQRLNDQNILTLIKKIDIHH